MLSSPKMSSRYHNNMSTKLLDITKQNPTNTLNRSMSEAVWELPTTYRNIAEGGDDKDQGNIIGRFKHNMKSVGNLRKTA